MPDGSSSLAPVIVLCHNPVTDKDGTRLTLRATAAAFEALGIEALKLGAYEYLTKPIAPA